MYGYMICMNVYPGMYVYVYTCMIYICIYGVGSFGGNGDSSGKDRGIESRYVWVYDMYECVSRYVCICMICMHIYMYIWG
jgi:hypothetical protein